MVLAAIRSRPRLLSSIPLEYVSVFISGGSHRIGYLARSEARAMAEECAVALSYASSIRSLKYIDVTKQVDLDKGPTRWWKIIRSPVRSYNQRNVLPDDTSEEVKPGIPVVIPQEVPQMCCIIIYRDIKVYR